MKPILIFASLIMSAQAGIAFAQSTANPSNTSGSNQSTTSGNSALPESMRIQQSVTEQNAADSANGTLSRASRPSGSGGAGASMENNRLDPSAPSPHRLQIDDGASAAVRNPDVDTVHPGYTGGSYNTIVRGAPSTSGVNTGSSTGASGLSGRAGSSSGMSGGGLGGGSAAGGSSGASGGSSGGGR